MKLLNDYMEKVEYIILYNIICISDFVRLGLLLPSSSSYEVLYMVR